MDPVLPPSAEDAGKTPAKDASFNAQARDTVAKRLSTAAASSHN